LGWPESARIAHPQTRIPVLFRGTHYLGTPNGLLISKDKGANWQTQGAAGVRLKVPVTLTRL